jgi:hypothetical protein
VRTRRTRSGREENPPRERRPLIVGKSIREFARRWVLSPVAQVRRSTKTAASAIWISERKPSQSNVRAQRNAEDEVADAPKRAAGAKRTRREGLLVANAPDRFSG